MPTCAISPRVAWRVPCRAAHERSRVPSHPPVPLRFPPSRQDPSSQKESAGQREGVDFLAIDDLDVTEPLRRNSAPVLTHPVHILGNYRIVNDLGLLLDFLREPFSERNLFFKRVEVYPLATSRLPIWSGSFFGSLARTKFGLAKVTIRIRLKLAENRCFIEGLLGQRMRLPDRDCPRGCLREGLKHR